MKRSQSNPFKMNFGITSDSTNILRQEEFNDVVDDFDSEDPSKQVVLVTGVRGSGKTVFMSNIAREFDQKDDWIVVSLSVNRPILEALASRLYANPILHNLFLKAKFNFSFFGLGSEIENIPPVTDIEQVIEMMLQEIQQLDMRLLVTIDEAANTNSIKEFASSFQLFIQQGYPIFLIMTGLYQNIDLLQNEDTLTFLYRAPKIEMKPLSLIQISNRYQKLIGLHSLTANKMAKMTNGYSFAFQILGHLAWDEIKKGTTEKQLIDTIFSDYHQNLWDISYIKMITELSHNDRHLLFTIAHLLENQEADSVKVADIKEALKDKANQYPVYRERLWRRGYLDVSQHGFIKFSLPNFKNFLLFYEEMYL